MTRLQKTYPILQKLTELLKQKSVVQGLVKENLNQQITITAKAIIENKTLFKEIQNSLPKFASRLQKRVERGVDKNHEQER